ncbi:MAG: MltA domain-containing protein [Alphaproteobacteria bacterium]|nr:MltA domain-containing protein [Alphaproteobacteria bacterium]MBP9877737.1 MltA domain-containing protein [Alphaproteobacteria bacterium]
MKYVFYCLSILSLMASAVCSAELSLAPISFDQLEGFSQDRLLEVRPALLKSCEKRLTQKNNGSALAHAVQQTLVDVCPELMKSNFQSDQDFLSFIRKNLVPYKVTNADGQGLFTGYYEPILKASAQKTGSFKYPLYALPPDFKTPYTVRADIERGKIHPSTQVLAWFEDPVQLYFLHVQGSGIVRYDDGSTKRFAFAGKNGQTYVSIGKYLIDQKQIEPQNMSKQSLEAWLYAHPERQREVFDQNPSFIFFKESQIEGAVGSSGVVLTKERSLAIDPAFMPYGALLWLQADSIDHPEEPDLKLRRLVVAQDTGSAIKGKVRGDLFWGNGDRAEHHAGLMKNKGDYFILLSKSASVR